MTTIVTEATIRRPLAEVYAFVTTPQHWLQWHPSSLGLSGATDHSLEVGEEVVEEFRVAGRRGSVTWRVVEREAPRLWVIAGRVAAGGQGTIRYTLAAQPDGTLFRRRFDYAMPNAFAALLDRVFVRRRIEAESAEAVRRLTHALERR
jgi:uncharacterized protein YndB with AHSA1/START domain